MGIVAPLIALPPSTRSTMLAAINSGLEISVRNGVGSWSSVLAMIASSIGVCVVPGTITLARTEVPANSRASVRVKAIMPDLEAAYAPKFRLPQAAPEAIFSTTPRCSIWSIRGTIARHDKNVPVRLTSRHRLQSSNSVLTNDPVGRMAAEFTSATHWDPISSVARCRHACASDTSNVRSSTLCSPRSPEAGTLSILTTRYSRAASSRTSAFPIPEEPPVTMAVGVVNSCLSCRGNSHSALTVGIAHVWIR